MHVFRVDMRRALCSKMFVIAVSGVFLAGLVGCLQEILILRSQPVFSKYQGNLYAWSVWSGAIYSEIFLLLLPVLGALPFASGAFEEWSSRFLVYYSSRTKRKNYINGKLWSVSLSGGLAVAAGLLLLLAVLHLLIPWDDNQSELLRSISAADIILISLQETVRVALNGSFWALAGCAAALIGKHLYLTWLAPFSACYLLDTFQRRYFSKWYLLNPRQWVTASILGPEKGILWMLLLNLLMLLLCKKLMERRSRDV